MGFRYTASELLAMNRVINELTSLGLGKRFSAAELSLKNSDTLVILGSGPSIARISSTAWQQVAQHDTIGFNWWLVHPFVPRFFAFQGVGERMLNLLSHEKHRYLNTSFFIRGSELASGTLKCTDMRLRWVFKKNAYYLAEYPMCGWYETPAQQLFDFMNAQGFLNFGKPGRFVPKWRSTLGLLLSFAYQMGYKTTVLAGMDMCSSRHFWDETPFAEVRRDYSPFLPQTESGILALRDATVAKPTLDEYVLAFKDWAHDTAGMNVCLLSPEGQLYPQLAVWQNTLGSSPNSVAPC